MSYKKGPLVFVHGMYANYIKTDEDSNYTVVASLDGGCFANEDTRKRVGLAMAAAPDLLEALKIAASYIGPNIPANEWDKIDTAIKKAESEDEHA